MWHRYFILTFYALALCWLAGARLGQSENERLQAEIELPYRSVMIEAELGLENARIHVEDPKKLPAIITCGICLQKREAFGAFTDAAEQVVVPENFDIATAEGKSVLIHEYGHFLLTKAGMPVAEQEKYCLMLGNSVYQKFFQNSFTTALN